MRRVVRICLTLRAIHIRRNRVQIRSWSNGYGLVIQFRLWLGLGTGNGLNSSILKSDKHLCIALLAEAWSDVRMEIHLSVTKIKGLYIAMSEPPEACQFSSTEAISQHCYNVSASN